ncbi:sce7726 family protein [Leptospira santarosai]|uniref:sce7726 family protein n=1 Tax=Leptospira santarosai TaxID=28183 RepID=UPI000773E2FD|nr:sce7726 family protein [Leptospira santarosai]MDI7215434.1 sce7726 family protein [Leptospira santarosai]
MALNDSVIRKGLKSYLKSKIQNRAKIIEELSIHNGNAIADIVSINKTLHCYEIKGETDKISRIEVQGAFYDLTFSYLTLVTTKNHIEKAIKNAPPHWGIIEVTRIKNKITFNQHRKAQHNTNIIKEKALLTLWKSELQVIYTKFYKQNPKINLNRIQLIDLICRKSTLKKINDLIAVTVYNRKFQL